MDEDLSFDRFLMQHHACGKTAQKVYTYLMKNCKLEGKCSAPRASFCFKITVQEGRPFTHISVSVPPDASGNRMRDFEDHEPYSPETYETALFKNEEFVNLEELCYEDTIKRFYSLEELAVEIKKLLLKEN